MKKKISPLTKAIVSESILNAAIRSLPTIEAKKSTLYDHIEHHVVSVVHFIRLIYQSLFAAPKYTVYQFCILGHRSK